MADRRTRELRKAAAVMNQPLSPEARAALDAGLESARRGEIRSLGSFAQYVNDDDPEIPPPPRVPRDMREPSRYDCGHARPRAVRLSGPWHACPGCERSDRRNRRHWFLLVAVAAVLLVTTCAVRASEGPCAPYSPIDGRTCAPPARLGYMGTAPVCFCPGPRVAVRP